MDLLTPSFGLVAWQAAVVIFIIIWLGCVVHLFIKKGKPITEKLLWFLAISIVPIVGCIVYLMFGRKTSMG